MKIQYRAFRVLAVIALIMITSLASAANQVVIHPYQIGDTGPAGGIVFYVDSGGQHGLEAAPSDQSTSIRWHNGVFTNTEARGDGVGAGEMNTMLIIANQGSDSDSYAAGLCAKLVDYNSGAFYGDWYLPSSYELELMYSNLHLVGKGGFDATSYYWSSTEHNSNAAWGQYFGNGFRNAYDKNITYRVRAVRAF